MPLNISPKSQSSVSSNVSQVVSRASVPMGQKSVSTARVEALKAKLGAPTGQPVAPRPARTSARQADMKELKSFSTTPTPPPKIGPTSARQVETDFSKIPLPPSGATQAVQVSSNEAPKPLPEATKEELSPQFVSLVQQEKRLRKAQKEFKAAQEAWKQEQAQYISKDRLTSETLKVLSEAGITADKLVELQINQASAQDPNQILLNRIAELESQVKSFTDPETGTLAQRDKQAYDQAVKQIRSDAKLLVDSNPNYGMIKSEGQTEEVVNLITAVFNQEGIILDVEEAADLIKDKLTSRIVKNYERMSNYDVVKAKFGKPAENQVEANKEKRTQLPISNTTLTNAGASTRPLSARDRAILRVQEALDAAKRK